jgi:hypothetical protein
VIADEGERILFLSKTYPGSVHDKTIIEQEGWQFPQGIIIHQDLGFLGHNPKGITIEMPVRKPKNGELTTEQKKENKQKASKRVKVEHALGKVKIYRILKDRIRLCKQGIKDLVMALGCALHNFKLNYKT